MDLSDYKVVSVGLAVAVPVLFWLVKRSRRSSKDTTSVPEIPLACADEMHWFLGHAPLMQDMLAGEKPPRRSPPSHVLAVALPSCALTPSPFPTRSRAHDRPEEDLRRRG